MFANNGECSRVWQQIRVTRETLNRKSIRKQARTYIKASQTID